MSENPELWDKYTDDNVNQNQAEVSKFIYHVSASLGAKKILEAGCNVGNNLVSFPKDYDIHGVDMNEHALQTAKKNFPNFNFKCENLSNIPFPDSTFDLVFTRNVLIHVPANKMDEVLKELLRVSKKWILNIEYYGEDGKMIKWKRGDDLLWYRNMKERWKKFDVEIVNEADIPLDIDFGNSRITIVKKCS